MRAKTGIEEEELSVEELEAKVKELEEMKNNSDNKLEATSVCVLNMCWTFIELLNL